MTFLCDSKWTDKLSSMLIPRHLVSTITYHKTKLIAMFNCHILWNRCVDTFVYHVQFFFKIPILLKPFFRGNKTKMSKDFPTSGDTILKVNCCNLCNWFASRIRWIVQDIKYSLTQMDSYVWEWIIVIVNSNFCLNQFLAS